MQDNLVRVKIRGRDLILPASMVSWGHRTWRPDCLKIYFETCITCNFQHLKKVTHLLFLTSIHSSNLVLGSTPNGLSLHRLLDYACSSPICRQRSGVDAHPRSLQLGLVLLCSYCTWSRCSLEETFSRIAPVIYLPGRLCHCDYTLHWAKILDQPMISTAASVASNYGPLPGLRWFPPCL
jgi:hypothetical protein